MVTCERHWQILHSYWLSLAKFAVHLHKVEQSLTFVAWHAHIPSPKVTFALVAGSRQLSIENEWDHIALTLCVAGGVNGALSVFFFQDWKSQFPDISWLWEPCNLKRIRQKNGCLPAPLLLPASETLKNMIHYIKSMGSIEAEQELIQCMLRMVVSVGSLLYMWISIYLNSNLTKTYQ